MREHAVSEGRELASAVEQLADRFAAKWTGSVHDRQVRELTHEFLFDVVDTLRRASIVEIAEALAALERDKARISAAARRPLERVRDRDRADERTKRTGAVAEEPTSWRRHRRTHRARVETRSTSRNRANFWSRRPSRPAATTICRPRPSDAPPLLVPSRRPAPSACSRRGARRRLRNGPPKPFARSLRR